MSRRNMKKVRPLGRATRGFLRAGVGLKWEHAVMQMVDHYRSCGHRKQIKASMAYHVAYAKLTEEE